MKSTNKKKLDELACKTEEAALNRFDPEDLEWSRLIGMELIKGDPLSTEEMAERLQVSTEKLKEIIETFHNIERNEEGKIVGLAGYSLKPTRHRCRIGEDIFYVWCAGDALGFPVLLDKTMEINSSCYATEEPIKLKVTPQSVESISPEDAVVSIIIPEDLPKDIRGFYCNRVNFFKSQEVASNWLSQNDDGIILPVEEAYQYYRKMMNKL